MPRKPHFANLCPLFELLLLKDFREHSPAVKLFTPSEFFVDKDCFGEDGAPEQAKTFMTDFHSKQKAEGALFALCISVPPRDKPLESGKQAVGMSESLLNSSLISLH